MTKLDKPSEILTNAKNLLNEDTWYKGYYFYNEKFGEGANVNDASKFCGIGSCHKAANYDINDINDDDLWICVNKTEQYLHNVAYELFPNRMLNNQKCFPNFNDHEDTTLEEVYRVFDLAIENAKKDNN